MADTISVPRMSIVPLAGSLVLASCGASAMSLTFAFDAALEGADDRAGIVGIGSLDRLPLIGVGAGMDHDCVDAQIPGQSCDVVFQRLTRAPTAPRCPERIFPLGWRRTARARRPRPGQAMQAWPNRPKRRASYDLPCRCERTFFRSTRSASRVAVEPETKRCVHDGERHLTAIGGVVDLRGWIST